MDKYINEPIPMTVFSLRSRSCQDIEKFHSTVSFPQRSTSLLRLALSSAPVSDELKKLPAFIYVPPLINKQLPPLPVFTYAPSPPTGKLKLLATTVYMPPKTTKELPSLPTTNNSRNLSNHSRISNDPSNFVLVDPRSVTVDTAPRTSSLLSSPSHPSLPLRKKGCRSPLLPPDEVKVQSLVQVTVQPPTPGTAPTSVPMSTPKKVKNGLRLDVKKRKKRKLAATRAKSRQSMLLSSKISIFVASWQRKASWRGPKIIKNNAFDLYGAGHRKSHTPDLPCTDSRKSIYRLIQRSEEATSPPPPVPRRTFEQMYLQILEERWACYRQLDAMREVDEKREIEEYLATHPVASPSPSPAPPSVPKPTSYPAETSSARREARRQARVAMAVKQLPTILEKDKLRPTVTQTTTSHTTAKKRLTISSPHLFPSPRSPREQCQQDEKNLKDTWREWLRSDRKERGKKKKLANKKVDNSEGDEDELRGISAYSDAELKVAFRYGCDDREKHKEAKKEKNRRWICTFFKMI